MRVLLWPTFRGEDEGDGGVRRVLEAQVEHLPAYDIELVGERGEPDVVAAHIDVPEPWWKNLRDKPFIIHNHGLYWAGYNWNGWALAANKGCMEAIRRADAVTAPSDWVARILKRHTSRPIVPIGHGVNVGEWEPGEDKGYVLWNKTRQDAVCNPEPVNILARHMPAQRFVTTFGREAANVLVTGRLPYREAREVLRHAAVYLSTAKETFGIGTLEAMACGVPVVGWDHGGNREILRHRETGWLAKLDDYGELAEGVTWAIAHRREIGEAGRAEVEAHYQWRDVVRAYAELYRSVAEGHGRPRPKVSVVVTAYGLDRYLPQCLDSVLAQSMRDWECVVVDDASPDGCGRIADEYAAKDGRFRAVHNRENLYLAGARNEGIASSSGRYIIPLDADDMLAPSALEELSTRLDEDRSIHIAYGGVRFVEENGQTLSVYPGHEDDPGHSGWPLAYRHEWELMGRNLLPYCSMLRREAWEWTGGYRSRCRTAEDADFWCRLSSYGFRPAMVTQNDTLIYRNRAHSMSRDEPSTDWTRWFPWSRQPEVAPAAAVTQEQLPIHALDEPLVAVVIPVGPGHERRFMDAVDSVDAQTFRSWECIVVNDTGGALPVQPPPWVRLLATGGTRGVAAARNLGIRASGTPLFVPLDADDYLQPQALEIMLHAWEQAGGVVYSDWWDQFSDGRVERYEAPEWDAHLLTRAGAIHAVTALYPKAAWEEAGGFDESLAAWEDWDLSLALADRGVCGSRWPEPLWTYRKSTGSRREANYADFEGSKAAIKAKWGELWDGRRELMACRGCPGGGGRRLEPRAIQRRDGGPPGDDVVVVEYVGASRGARTYRGPATGTQYRFSADPGENIRYVYRRDGAFFAGQRDFRVMEVRRDGQQQVPEAEPQLVIEGPPQRQELEGEPQSVIKETPQREESAAESEPAMVKAPTKRPRRKTRRRAKARA